jgi:hypothetical protein
MGVRRDSKAKDFPERHSQGARVFSVKKKGWFTVSTK